MLHFYSAPGCTSCRKARHWLKSHEIEYKERNIVHQPLSARELRKILSMTEEGTDDIISTRSKAFQQLKINIEEMNIQELLELLSSNPNLLRRPMLIDDKRLQIGFNEDEIRCFLPRKVRRLEMHRAQMISGV